MLLLPFRFHSIIINPPSATTVIIAVGRLAARICRGITHLISDIKKALKSIDVKMHEVENLKNALAELGSAANKRGP